MGWKIFFPCLRLKQNLRRLWRPQDPLFRTTILGSVDEEPAPVAHPWSLGLADTVFGGHTCVKHRHYLLL